MPSRAKSPSPSPSPVETCPRHGEGCRFPAAPGHRAEQPVAPLTRVTWHLGRVPFVVWFLLGVLLARLLSDAGVLEPYFPDAGEAVR